MLVSILAMILKLGQPVPDVDADVGGVTWPEALHAWPAALAGRLGCPYVVTPGAQERMKLAAAPELADMARVGEVCLALERGCGLQVWFADGVMVWLSDDTSPALPAAAARRALRRASAGPVGGSAGAIRDRLPGTVAGGGKSTGEAVDVRRRVDHISEARRLLAATASGDATADTPGRG